MASVTAIRELGVNLIVVHSDSGKLARAVARYRPEVSVICVSSDQSVVNQMGIYRGINSIKCDEGTEIDNMFMNGILFASENNHCKSGDKAVAIYGVNEDTPQETNYMKIIPVE